MKHYLYPYQKIVDLKHSEKTQAEWMLSSALGKLQSEVDNLKRLNEERLEWMERLQSAAGGGIPLMELQNIQSYVEYLDGSIERKTSDVKHARKNVEINQTNLSDKMKDEKVWEKAKEKALHKFMHAMRLKEQNELDEMATVRYVMPAR
ncbi:flagellar export protein FliJ [Paenibacillus tarimensis]|uniref:flagellar export protein FliJ n=1 Tax=Paenibacillus tarimensis TaxID=416012 RepID=UPI001F21CF65|nr:flagellar export protein FliJ [Paenibacillus tarimensis]MCF2942306.1 flagellar export protein FliJ [Paenibacillus tarimensis]